jgi:hypothetical protein
MIKQSPAYIFEPILPLDIVYVINSFLPKPVKPKKKQVSPSFQKELQKIQSVELKGKSGMFMRDLEDFLLD